MRILKFLLQALLLLVVVFFVVGYTISDVWTISRSIKINASAEKIYPYVSNFKEWEKWSPWNTSKDATLAYTYSGSEEGVGSKQAWTSSKMGTGSMQITAAEPQTGVTYDLSIDMGYIQSTLQGTIAFAPAHGATNVTWTDKGQANGNYIKRWTNFLVKPMLGTDLDTALAGLKNIVEAPVQN